MARRTTGLTLDHLDDLPGTCRTCLVWELDPVARTRAEASGDPALDKEAWLSSVMLAWGTCGVVAHVDGAPAGHALYAPPGHVPRAAAFPTSPVSPDAVLLSALRVRPGAEGQGVGRMLVQAVARDLVGRGVRAVEAFGAEGPSPGLPGGCLVPAGFLRSVGFTTVREHPRLPRLRMDLRTALTWRADVEVALERLLGSVAPEPALRPA